MSDDSRLPTSHDSPLVNEISCYVYSTIVNIQKQQPELLIEKYRHLAWHDVRCRSVFTAKLTEKLSKMKKQDALLLQVQKFLQILLTPNCLKSPLIVRLFQEIDSLYRSKNDISYKGIAVDGKISENGAVSASSHFADPSSTAFQSLNLNKTGIAILLLDVENLQLNSETEKFLATVCTYPIQIKVAFANWRTMGKQDAEFHGRGYELIHVPAGKDSADVKMATVGSSIFVHYPNAKEVLVCSSDNVLRHLCNTLQTHGLIVHFVRKQGSMITVLNGKTGQTQVHSLKPTLQIPSLEELVTSLKSLIKIEQARTNNQWVKLSRISNLFQTKYNLTINQVVATHLPGKRARDIFINYPTDFAVHQLPEQSQPYITLFEIPQSKVNSKNLTESTESNPQKAIPDIHSPDDLQQALINLLQTLTPNFPEKHVPLPTLGSEFHKRYGEPVTQLIQHLQLGDNFLKFLQSCDAFKLEKTGKTHRVGLREESSTFVEITPHD